MYNEPNNDTCNQCGGEKVLNPKTGKMFCKNKCWLNRQSNAGQRQAAPQQFNNDLQNDNIKKMAETKNETIKKAHEENNRSACLEAASRIVAVNIRMGIDINDDVLAKAKEYLKWVEGKTE